MQETSHPNKHLAKQIHLGKGDFMHKSISWADDNEPLAAYDKKTV